ncbi:unnamed protein product [Dracunculus medinensis]|uniref:Hydroxysteroid dehydrogenase-like protein 2 n=1 Tax=Dracunculus medinensis TaxID=318479 RepID=A0A0N4UL13_DRAME|nr:unnamed protein product [Dracunculus medinensis]
MLNTGKFAGLTAVITGASRGIGKEIALKLAKDGANIVVAAKTVAPHPKLPGTIYSAVEEIEKQVGGRGLACAVDVRDEESVENAVKSTVEKFGRIDILINNASAISLTGTLETSMKHFDLMHKINTRGTFLVSQKCIPYLKKGKNPHILNISPPLVMEKHWFANHLAYTIAKYGMSMCVLGMHEELRPFGIAVNSLWPRTAIWTAAMDMLSSGMGQKGCRKAEIMADAAYSILSRNSDEYTGNFAIDDEILSEEGIRDFDKYAVDSNSKLTLDFFLPKDKFSVKANKRKNDEELNDNSMDIEQVLINARKLINSEIVRKVNAIYQFHLKSETDDLHLYFDLKNGDGTIREGIADQSDVQFELNINDFQKLFNNDISAAEAFMSERLKIKGNMSKAIQLDNLLQKIK